MELEIKKGSRLSRLVGTGIDIPLLKLIVGILGILLPIAVMVWGFFINGWSLQNSLSDYYSLRTRDAFVGVLFVIGWIIFTYKGPEKMDQVAGKLVCLFAMGVALFPNSGHGWERIVHFSCAACLFLLLAFFSLYLFTKTHDSKPGFKNTVKTFRFRASRRGEKLSPEKRNRNIIYLVCGIVILACLLLLPLYYQLWQDTVLSNIKPVFWLETLMIWAFGLAWFTKGDTIFRDKETPKGIIEPQAVSK